MTLTRKFIGQHPDTGLPYFDYVSDGHIVLTGKASGSVTLADGTSYNVGDEVIEVACDDPSREHCVGEPGCHSDEVTHLIDLQHEETGALDSVDDDGLPIYFKHAPCVVCDGA